MPGYVDLIEELNQKFPLSEPRITGEQNQKEFIALFGAILRMRNLLVSFDDFKGKEGISERDLQDYLGRYQDLRDEWSRKRRESTDITDDVVFEVELIHQIEINIDYILMLVKKYHDTHCEDKEVLITIRKAVDASPELRSKKQLIENFIAGINEVDDVMDEWNNYVAQRGNKILMRLSWKKGCARRTPGSSWRTLSGTGRSRQPGLTLINSCPRSHASVALVPGRRRSKASLIS